MKRVQFLCCGVLLACMTAGVASAQQTSFARREVFAFRPASVPLADLGVVAFNTLAINDRARVQTLGGVLRPVANVGSSGFSNVGADSFVADVWSQSSVLLRDRANLNGAARSMSSISLQSPPTIVTGGVFSNSSFDLARPSLAVAMPTSGPNVTVPPNGSSVALAPGVYGQVVVNAGSSLGLSGGYYYIQNLQIESNANVSLAANAADAPAVVNVASSLTYRGTTTFAPGTNESDLTVVYLGTATANLETRWRASIIAPYAKLDVKSSSTGHDARLIGRDVELHQGSVLRMPDATFGDILPGFTEQPFDTVCTARPTQNRTVASPTRAQMIAAIDQFIAELEILNGELNAAQ